MNSGTASDRTKGLVLEIQRMSTDDGPGIRTTVFMKGCPLSCAWCHNPESISTQPQVRWTGAACLMCGACAAACPEGALSLSEKGVSVSREKCRACGACAEKCPSASIEMWGKYREAGELALELAKDRAWFESSGGGVTISGGESTMQAPFVSELLKELRAEGISTAIDTCGLFPESAFRDIFSRTELILYDIKQWDPQLHKKFTGVSNEKILENLRSTAAFARENVPHKKIWVRTPVIPGATAGTDNIENIGRFLSSLPSGAIERWELCAFNNLCAPKYSALGLKWSFADTPLAERGLMEELFRTARSSGVDPAIVSWKGEVR